MKIHNIVSCLIIIKGFTMKINNENGLRIIYLRKSIYHTYHQAVIINVQKINRRRWFQRRNSKEMWPQRVMIKPKHQVHEVIYFCELSYTKFKKSTITCMVWKVYSWLIKFEENSHISPLLLRTPSVREKINNLFRFFWITGFYESNLMNFQNERIHLFFL